MRSKLDELDGKIATAEARLTVAKTALLQFNQEIAVNRRTLRIVKARARERALLVYQHGAGANNSIVTLGSVEDLNSATRYVSAALDIDDSDLSSLTSLQHSLADARDQRALDVDHVKSTQADLAGQQEQLVVLQRQEQALLDQWGAVPVMGNAWLTAGQIAGWFKSTGAQAQLVAGTTIDDIARLYVIEGNAEHVRGDLAFAQAMVETGSFQVDAGNNYSGIGVCDSCTGGYVFPTPLDGIRAQIQLLRNYADPDSRARLLANVASPTLYGSDPVKAAALYDTFFLKGKAPLWNQMGNGNWATDPIYAQQVIEVFAQMVVYAAAHPAA